MRTAALALAAALGSSLAAPAAAFDVSFQWGDMPLCNTIAPGAFKYASPCPPGGKHTYEWTAVARDKAGKTLATAKARRKYP